MIDNVEILANPAGMSYILKIESKSHKEIDGLTLNIRIKHPYQFEQMSKRFWRLKKGGMFFDALLHLHKAGDIEILQPGLRKLIVINYPDNFDAIRKIKEFRANG